MPSAQGQITIIDLNDGASYYTYIKYGDSLTPSTIYDTPNGHSYIGLYTGPATTPPSTYTDYTWSRFVGSDGNSESIKEATISYCRAKIGTGDQPSEIDNSIGESGWQSSVPLTNTDYPYLWTRVVLSFNNSSNTSTSYSVSSTMDSIESTANAAQLTANKAVEKVEYEFISVEKTATPNADGWSTSMPDSVAKDYKIWSRPKYTYKDGTSGYGSPTEFATANGLWVFTNNVAADSSYTEINGGAIEAKSITADQIEAETITADQIALHTITADQIASDAIKSDNYQKSSDSTSPYSNSGTFLDLANGNISTPNFGVNEDGAFINGTVTATQGNIGGCVIDSDGHMQINNANIKNITQIGDNDNQHITIGDEDIEIVGENSITKLYSDGMSIMDADGHVFFNTHKDMPGYHWEESPRIQLLSSEPYKYRIASAFDPISKIQIEDPEDTYILCSDGYWGYYTDGKGTTKIPKIENGVYLGVEKETGRTFKNLGTWVLLKKVIHITTLNNNMSNMKISIYGYMNAQTSMSVAGITRQSIETVESFWIRSDAGHVTDISAKRVGQVVQLYFLFVFDTAFDPYKSATDDITIEIISGPLPIGAVRSSAMWGSRPLLCMLRTNGTITLRNLGSATIQASNSVGMSFTYITDDQSLGSASGSTGGGSGGISLNDVRQLVDSYDFVNRTTADELYQKYPYEDSNIDETELDTMLSLIFSN